MYELFTYFFTFLHHHTPPVYYYSQNPESNMYQLIMKICTEWCAKTSAIYK